MVWFIVAYAALTSGGALFLALRLARVFRSPETPTDKPGHSDSLSVLVPIKGVDRRTRDGLQALVSSALAQEAQFVFAMETEEDPAFPVCDELRRSNPDRNIEIVFSGEPRGLMGKQHNLVRAFEASDGEVIVCMDADIEVEADAIAKGLPYLREKDAGSAFLLPVYGGEAPVGGRLVEIYLNYHYNLTMGALATLTRAPYIFGGLWMTRRSSLERTGGFASFGRTVSDDAAIGRAFLELGLRNLLVPETVHTPNENLGLFGGLRHLAKWVGMLRAEGLGAYLAMWLWWHPLFWSATFLALGLAAGWLRADSLIYGALGVGLCLAAKTATGAILNVGVYRRGALHSSLVLLAYELLVVPLVFGAGLFRRSITWKGRRYRLGSRGMVVGLDDSD